MIRPPPEARPRRCAPTRCGTRSAYLPVLLAAALALGACDKGSTRSPARPHDRLTTAIISDPKTFNPVLVTDATSGEALDLIFEALVRIDPKTTQAEPALAESWSTSNEGRTWTFELRRGVTWHDGRPFTAADVAFTFRAIFDESVPNSARYTLTVDGENLRVEVLGDYRVAFHMPRAFAPFLHAIAVPILPAHLLAESLDTGTFTQKWGIDTPVAELIGTGPWRLIRYVSAQVLEFERNPTYWRRDAQGKQLPYLRGRVTLIVPDQNTIALRFLAGQTHYYEPRPEEIPNLQDRADELGIVVQEIGIDTGNQFVVFNRNPHHWAAKESTEEPDPRLAWFTDRNFLQALAHAVDKRGMVDTIYYGFGVPSVSNISPANHVFHYPGLKDYAYDPKRARKILDQAGYTDRDGDGIREDPAGNPIVFGLTTNAGNTLRERLCSILFQDWRALGLDIHYRPQTFQSLVERLNITHDFDAILIGFTAAIDPHNGANFLRSSGNLHIWNPNQEKPETEWEAEIDHLLDAGAAELDQDKRKLSYWRIQQIIHHQLPFIGTVRQRKAIAYSRDLKNFHPLVWGLWHPNQIDIAPPER
jgi:peptide/nickel transport system substrate-binding protein